MSKLAMGDDSMMREGHHVPPRTHLIPATANQWDVCTEPGGMLDIINRKGTTGRKLRLFCVACFRLEWNLGLADQVIREAVDAAEKAADGVHVPVRLDLLEDAAAKELARNRQMTCPHGKGKSDILRTSLMAWRCCWDNAQNAARAIINAPDLHDSDKCDLIREVWGNPFREFRFHYSGVGGFVKYRPGDPVQLHADADCEIMRYNDGAVPKAAESIYQGRKWDELPILADLVTDAGLEDTNLLAHIRGPGPHYRGCWATDLLRGRA